MKFYKQHADGAWAAIPSTNNDFGGSCVSFGTGSKLDSFGSGWVLAAPRFVSMSSKGTPVTSDTTLLFYWHGPEVQLAFFVVQMAYQIKNHCHHMSTPSILPRDRVSYMSFYRK